MVRKIGGRESSRNQKVRVKKKQKKPIKSRNKANGIAKKIGRSKKNGGGSSKSSSGSKYICQVCNKQKSSTSLVNGDFLHGALLESIKRKVVNWDSNAFLCLDDLKVFREDYIRNLIKVEKGELSKIDKELLKSLKKQELLSKNVDTEFDSKISLGARLSDKIAEIGGSWYFLIFFGVFLIVWFFINTVMLISKPFDPFPFILLNLLLSCLAAIQAPIIMMSQNRQESKDRIRNEYDYKINMKAELEIRHLHEKLDQLRNHQWKRLIDIQRVQMDLIEELRKKK